MLKLTDKIVYKAEVETNDGMNELSTKVNFGIKETEFTTKYKTIQCHLKTGHTNVIPNFRNLFGV